MKRTLGSLLVLASLLALDTSAHAQGVVYDNGSYSTHNAYDMTSVAEADDFTLTTATTFNAIRFWAADDSGNPGLPNFSGTLSYFIHTDAANKPGSVINSGTVSSGITFTDTGAQVAGFNIYQLDFSVADTLLGPGTYWLRLKENGPTAPDDGSSIYWSQSVLQTGNLDRVDGNEVNPTTWNGTNSADQAFQLRFNTTSVPEPAFVAMSSLLALGGGGLLLRRRRARS